MPHKPPLKKLLGAAIGAALLALVAGVLLQYVRTQTAPDLISPSNAEQFGRVAAELGIVTSDKIRPAPIFPFHDTNGNTVTFTDFQGKVTLVNLWATWCDPCREEMPSLDRLQEKLGGQDFQVVAIAVNHDPDSIRGFYKEFGITNLEVYIDTDARSLSALRLSGIPTTLLIDREGNEIGRVFGSRAWDEKQMVALLTHYVEN
ncbi:MAG: TlpA disulfide reductase family protein [Proteobacteria bacterium]|nr:TlpA disulfide reductase family protein [Pseudomonadota bacterium]